ncbi:MAG: hypothetical protein M0R38_10780 [Bacteroidia bacterium]|nr:hypothetical protein [Bacteroidia bacterium]
MGAPYKILGLNLTKPQFQDFASSLDLHFSLNDDLSPLLSSYKLKSGTVLSNRFLVQPMEGFDALENGSPSRLTFRRYKRFAQGGSSVIWLEAVAISAKGRGHKGMLYLTSQNQEEFATLIDTIHEEGNGTRPFVVLQLHHSGRYGDFPALVFNEEQLNRSVKNIKDAMLLTDKDLEKIKRDFISAGRLAEEVGVDAVDVKCCHGYLLYELLQGRTRKGKYGGSYENRTRIIFEIIEELITQVGIKCVVRMDGYTGVASPYGWGMDDRGSLTCDEQIRFAKDLALRGVDIVNVTNGSPHTMAYLSRPYNSKGEPPEHPLVSLNRMIQISKAIQKEVCEVGVVVSGFSSLRKVGLGVAARLIKDGDVSFIGYGRQSFANPNLPSVISNGEFSSFKEYCTCCDGCIELLESGRATGCSVYDRVFYRR